jgi:hypothetical protein
VLIEVQPLGIAVESFLGEEGREIDTLQDRIRAHTVMALVTP